MDSVCLATAGDDIKLWDHGFSLLRSFNPYAKHNVASLSWNFEGTLLASSAVESEKVVLTYTKNALMTAIELPCGAGVQCTDFSADSRFMLCGGTEGVSVWDLKTRTLKKSFQAHKSPVTTARYNWNHSYIASGSKTGEIILHNTVSGQSSSPIVTPNTQAILQLEYSTSKKSMFGTASDNGAVTLWDANTRRMLHSFKDAHVTLATGLAFSPINEMLMMSVGLDKRFVCYDIQRKHVLKVIDAQSPLTCIDIMQDGATAAVGSTQGKIYVYDLRQGGSTPIQVLQAHKTSVQSVKFVPAGKSKSEDSSNGMKVNVSAGSRRQLPSAPSVMQDITPSKTGQTPDVQSHTANSSLGMDIFSPLAGQGNESRSHSKSVSLLNLTNSRGEDSLTGMTGNEIHNQSKSALLLNLTNSRGEDSLTGINSSLRKGLVDLSAASQSGCHGPSSLSLSSFLQPQAAHSSTSPEASKLQSPTPANHQTSRQPPDSTSSVTAATTTSPASRTTPHFSSSTTATTTPSVIQVLSDSAVMSGSEDGESGISPRQDASQSSLPFTTRPTPASRTAGTAAGPVDVGAAGEPGVTQREFLKSLITDAMEDVRDELHRDIQGLHVAMLRQFFNFEREMQSTLSHYSETNQKLMMYVRQLEEENRRLKKNY